MFGKTAYKIFYYIAFTIFTLLAIIAGFTFFFLCLATFIDSDFYLIVYAIFLLPICLLIGGSCCFIKKPESKFFSYSPMFFTAAGTLLGIAFFLNPVINSDKYFLTALFTMFGLIIGPIVFILLFRKINSETNLTESRESKEFETSKKFSILPTILIISAVTYVIVSYIRYEPNLEKYRNDGIYFGEYVPFSNGNILPELDFNPSTEINSDYPKVDGATAFFPVYSTVVQSVYKGINVRNVDRYVGFSKTGDSYTKLINGETDIIFTLEPSNKQIKEAENAGTELIFTPIGKEAFIFFVHDNNLLNSLTIEQIQDIYTQSVTQWSEVGGNEEESIYAMSRPKNSGSQTIMENKVMNGLNMSETAVYQTMYDILEGAISDAKHGVYPNGIGYSFRFFVEFMARHSEYKIININEIEPSLENIKNESYPLVVEFYAVTTKESMEKDNVKKLVDWLISDEGQRLIELTGYSGN